MSQNRVNWWSKCSFVTILQARIRCSHYLLGYALQVPIPVVSSTVGAISRPIAHTNQIAKVAVADDQRHVRRSIVGRRLDALEWEKRWRRAWSLGFQRSIYAWQGTASYIGSRCEAIFTCTLPLRRSFDLAALIHEIIARVASHFSPRRLANPSFMMFTWEPWSRRALPLWILPVGDSDYRGR